MDRLIRFFLTGAVAACALTVTATAFADIPFGFFSSRNGYRTQEYSQEYHYHNPQPHYHDPYNDYQRMQRQADNVRRQQENLSRDYQHDIQQFQRQHQYMRHRRHSSRY